MDRKERIAQLRAELLALEDEDILEPVSADLKRQCLALIRGGHPIAATQFYGKVMEVSTGQSIRFINALRRQNKGTP